MDYMYLKDNMNSGTSSNAPTSNVLNAIDLFNWIILNKIFIKILKNNKIFINYFSFLYHCN